MEEGLGKEKKKASTMQEKKINQYFLQQKSQVSNFTTLVFKPKS